MITNNGRCDLCQYGLYRRRDDDAGFFHLMIFCADDYGMAPDINEAILELVSARRLSAVSCMVALRACDPGSLAPLLGEAEQIDIGLHLCLADETLSNFDCDLPPKLPSFGKLLLRCFLGLTTAASIRTQIAAQYDLFLQKCGRAPDYIDGHLHAHQLPTIRQTLVQFAAEKKSRLYVRNTNMRLGELRRNGAPILKAAFISAFGGACRRELLRAGVPTNDGFAGIYDFRNSSRYPEYFQAFGRSLANENAILVLHPGKNEEWRRQEYLTLKSAPGDRVPNRFKHSQRLAAAASPSLVSKT